MIAATIPTFFRNRNAGFAGLVDYADVHDGIRGWILRINQPNRPVQWRLMGGDATISTGLADVVRQDISAALGREARCTFHIAWIQFGERALETIARLPTDAPLRLVVVETGEEVQWAIERPNVGWLADVIAAGGNQRDEKTCAVYVPRSAPNVAPGADGDALALLTASPGRLSGRIHADPVRAAGAETDNSPDGGDVARPALAATTAPASRFVNGATGHPEAGIAFEHCFVFEGTLCAAGWTIGAEAVEFRFDETVLAPSLIVFLDRPDIAAGYRVPMNRARGFVALWLALPAFSAVSATVGTNPLTSLGMHPVADGADRQASDLLRYHPCFAASVLRHARAHPGWLRIAAGSLQDAPEGFKEARGFIEQAKAIPQVGGLMMGWSIRVPPCEIIALSENGAMVSLDGASRWTRDDIIAAFGVEFGAFTYDSGYLTALHAPLEATGRLCLVAVTEAIAYVIARAVWEPAPIDPISFARWAFELPSPAYNFSDRLPAHDAPLIEQLIKRKNASLRHVRADVRTFGQPNTDPRCSLIVPIYGRYDFIRHQLLAFADDAFISTSCEIVYVLDDPRVADAFVGEADAYIRLYGVPFRIAVGGVNRGYSGATNLGARLSTAPRLLLLNSDVIPLAPGWLERMCDLLDTSDRIGAVGARLLYPNGSLQHEGMDFAWEPQLNAYVNTHPGMGYPPDLMDCRPQLCEAVTGACLLIRRAEFEAVGMLDEEFLIGDFEDSDLCLKLRERGRDIVLFRDLVLVHLERQSLSLTGETLFRERVVRYNAWRHQQRWGQVIAQRQESVRGRSA